jgi:rhodanese-related sulfurtransferase
VREVDPRTAQRLVDDGALVLDVREDDEWEAGRAPGAAHIPLAEIAARKREIPTETTVVTVCRAGGRSARAASAMAQGGYDVVSLAGGMRAWSSEGLPVVRADGTPGSVV